MPTHDHGNTLVPRPLPAVHAALTARANNTRP